jgi:uncharacterized repeat protein (TIGR03803 family)
MTNNGRPPRLNLSATITIATLTLALTLAFLTPLATAQTFQVIHNFTGNKDGANPWAGLTMDRAGNFYGITEGGGTGTCVFYGTSGCGTAYRLTHDPGGWVIAPLYQFQGGTDGEFPIATLTIGPNGSLYGTTTGGGMGTCTYSGSTGCGTVFNLLPPATSPKTVFPTWLERILYRFTGGSDGANPNIGNLIFDHAGNMYGTTEYGGANNFGAVFELSPSGGGWTETVLYSFAGGDDGAYAFGGLLFDNAGNLYGTTGHGGGTGCGGGGCGTIYELSPSGGGWTEKILYIFQGGNDGIRPDAGLIFDPLGNLYGGTYDGGAGGGGTVYELSPSGGGNWSLTTLYSFVGSKWGLVARLLMDSSGNLYDTTQYGGANGDGNAFKLTNNGSGNWSYTDLHDFTYGADGGVPVDSLVMDSSGNLYGTAFGGGANPCGGGYGCGVIFEITP